MTNKTTKNTTKPTSHDEIVKKYTAYMTTRMDENAFFRVLRLDGLGHAVREEYLMGRTGLSGEKQVTASLTIYNFGDNYGQQSAQKITVTMPLNGADTAQIMVSEPVDLRQMSAALKAEFMQIEALFRKAENGEANIDLAGYKIDCGQSDLNASWAKHNRRLQIENSERAHIEEDSRAFQDAKGNMFKSTVTTSLDASDRLVYKAHINRKIAYLDRDTGREFSFTLPIFNGQNCYPMKAELQAVCKAVLAIAGKEESEKPSRQFIQVANPVHTPFTGVRNAK